MDLPLFLTGLATLALGALIAWLVGRGTRQHLRAERDRSTADLTGARSDIAALRDENSQLQRALAESREQVAALRATAEAEQRAVDDKLALLASSELRLKDAFTALASDVLQQSGATFLELAGAKLGEMRAHSNADLDSRKAEVEQLIAPLREGLERLNGVVDGVEKARISAFASLHEQLRAVAEGSTRLQAETRGIL